MVEEYFILLKPVERREIVPNTKSYGYDEMHISMFVGVLEKKENTTFSQNVRCTFRVHDGLKYHLHHPFLERIKSKLDIGKKYRIKINEKNYHLINVEVFHEIWDMFIPYNAELTGISKLNTGKFRVYRYDDESRHSKSFGEFEKLEYAMIFRDYCKKRKWNDKLETNTKIGKQRTKALKYIFKHNAKKDWFKELDKYFEINKEEKISEVRKVKPINKCSLSHAKSVYDIAFEQLSIIEESISKGIVSKNTSLEEYMNTIRAIHIAKNSI